MHIRASETITKTVIMGVKCPFHPLVPLGFSIQSVRNANDESNVITRPTICVHSKVKVGNALMSVHTHLHDRSYIHVQENLMELPVTRFTDAKLEEENILNSDEAT